MNITAYISLLGVVLLGGLIGLLMNNDKSKKYLTFILPFSGAFLLGIVVTHMLPELFAQIEQDHFIGLYILLGFLIQIFLEFLSKGVEHGHVHPAKTHKTSFLISIMLGLCIHAFIEGMPVGNTVAEHVGHDHAFSDQPYLWGIVVHKFPAAIALSLLLLASGISRTKTIFLLFVFGIMSPLGSLVTDIYEFNTHFQRIILAIAVGSILHIATIIIYETDENAHHKISYRKLFAIFLGFILAIISIF